MSKTIGLIGGMSYASTITYYQFINEFSQEHFKSLSKAKILISSVDFSKIEQCQKDNNWQEAATILSTEARKLEKAGADIVGLCTNTMHKVADEIQNSIKIPFIHIAKSCVQELKSNNIKNILLLGTKYTLKEDFYKKIITQNDINVVIPNDDDITTINDIIFNELCENKITSSSKEKYINIINKQNNIDAILLACTEISLLINESDFKNLKVFDTTYIHAKDLFNKSLWWLMLAAKNLQTLKQKTTNKLICFCCYSNVLMIKLFGRLKIFISLASSSLISPLSHSWS